MLGRGGMKGFDVKTFFSELEQEYRRQIDYYKGEEQKAKELLRQKEIEFLQQKQQLEAQIDQQQSIVILCLHRSPLIL